MSDDNRKVALVFGGSRGIGAAIVSRLAEDGYAVPFTYVSRPDAADGLADKVRDIGGEALAIKADSASLDDIKAAVATTIDRFGRLDVVVVNAGVARMGMVDAVPLEDLDLQLDVNVRGVFLAIQAALPHLKEGGRIVTIGSNIALRSGFPGASVYQTTKAAVAGMVKGLALDLAPRGITINNVQPGPTKTDMIGSLGNEGMDMVMGMVPLKRMAEPEEIAGLVSYIVRDEAGYVTGASLTIDGGFAL
jgi:3-oxoacyl-[acyl-carrier protein] reductase